MEFTKHTLWLIGSVVFVAVLLGVGYYISAHPSGSSKEGGPVAGHAFSHTLPYEGLLVYTGNQPLNRVYPNAIVPLEVYSSLASFYSYTLEVTLPANVEPMEMGNSYVLDSFYGADAHAGVVRSEEHTSELQSQR